MTESLTWRRLPSAIPVNNAALYAAYAPIVTRIVRHKVKYGITHADAESELWARLMRARVIDRYVLNRLAFDPGRPPGEFRAYFCAAAYNHLKNVFRTLDRRANREKALGDDLMARLRA